MKSSIMEVLLLRLQLEPQLLQEPMVALVVISQQSHRRKKMILSVLDLLRMVGLVRVMLLSKVLGNGSMAQNLVQLFGQG